MKQSLGALVLCLMNCSEYEMHTTPENNGELSYQVTSDSGEHLESYDSCDPYDLGWDIAPEGTERAACFGIEDGILRYNSSRNIFMTNIYLGDCEEVESGIGFITMDLDYYSQEDNYYHIGASAGFGSSTSPQCGYSDFASFDIRPYFSSEYFESLSNGLIAYQIWVGSQEEKNQGMTTNELRALTEPLEGIIDCRDAAEVAETVEVAETAELADCVVSLYH